MPATPLRLLAWDQSLEKVKRTTVDPGNLLPSGTTGSLTFYDTSGFLAENNAQLFWDNTGDKLGIGTNAPSASLSILNPAASASGLSVTLSNAANIGRGLEIQVIGSGAQIFRSDGSGGVEEKYFHSTVLTANSTNAVAPTLKFDTTIYCGVEISYSVIEAASNAVRVGTLRVANDGTTLSLMDDFCETQSLNLSWNAVYSGTTANLQYTNGTRNQTLRADIKRFKF